MPEDERKRFVKLKIIVGASLFTLELGVHTYLMATNGEGLDPWLLGLPFVLMGVDSSLFTMKK